MRSRTAQGSIAWILGLLTLPFPMTLFYAVFGLKLFDDYAAIQTHSGRVLRKVRAAKTKILDQPSAEEWPVLVNVSQIPFLKGNDVELLIDGEATFDSIFAGSRQRSRRSSSSSTSFTTTSSAANSPTG